MTKTILSLLFMIGTFLSSFSQDKSFKFGMEVGGNYGKFDFTENESRRFDNSSYSYSTFNAEFGFTIGLYGSYGFSETIGIETGVLFNQLNNKFGIGSGSGSSFPLADGSTIGNISGSVIRNTLSFPFFLKFFRNNKINADLGPSFEYTVENDISYNQAVITEFLEESERDESEFGLNARVNLSITNKIICHLKFDYLTKTKALMSTLSISYQIN